jgi:hypothetical protein
MGVGAMKFYKSILVGLAVCSAAPLLAETLNNDAVIAMVGAGLGEETVIAKIKNSPNTFNLETANLIALKKQGLSDAVIAAMLDASTKAQVSANAMGMSDSPDPHAPHASGIYVLADWAAPSKMVRMDATAANQSKNSGMLGYALTGGLASVKVKTVLPNSVARVKVTKKRPVFYFYFDQANAGLSGGAPGSFSINGGGTPVTSPNEFSLVRFDIKKGNREATVGKMNIVGGKAGVMDKARVSFDYSDVAPGVFRVTSNEDLTPGEYGFVYSSANGGGVGIYGGGGMTSRIFDFSVQ